LDCATAEPALLAAVTATRSIELWSLAVTVYRARVASLMLVQFASVESQRCH